MQEKLHTLVLAMEQISKQYHMVATELANLKNKPNNDAKNESIIAKLSDNLKYAEQRNHALQQELKELREQFDHTDKQNKLLHKENQLLIASNHELQQKNVLAIEHAELIQSWLHKIDTAQS